MQFRTRCPALVAVGLIPLASQSLSAQTHQVVPASATTIAGDSLDREPFGYDQVRHVSYYDRTLLNGIPLGALLTEIAYRREESILNPALMERRSGTTQSTPLWQVRVGTYSGSWQTPPPAFPAVGAVGWTTVIASRQIDFLTNFPPLPVPASGLPDFLVRFPFDAPLVPGFGGQSLGIEHFSYEGTQRSYAYYVDYVESSPGSGSAGLISPTSLGCPAGQNRAEGAAPNPGAGDMEVFLFGAEPNVAAFAYIGVSETSWNGLPLPASLSALGLAGCAIHCDWLVAAPMLTSSAGTAEFRLPVPLNATYAGQNFYAQWVLSDTRVNPAFPFASSDGLKLTIGTQMGGSMFPASTVSAVGGLANGRTGFVQPGRAPVVRFTW